MLQIINILVTDNSSTHSMHMRKTRFISDFNDISELRRAPGKLGPGTLGKFNRRNTVFDLSRNNSKICQDVWDPNTLSPLPCRRIPPSKSAATAEKMLQIQRKIQKYKNPRSKYFPHCHAASPSANLLPPGKCYKIFFSKTVDVGGKVYGC